MNNPGHMDYLDGWRGIAILLLVAGHFSLIPSIGGHNFYTGRVGVEFFFVLSGRLMAEILFHRESPIGYFYWRRISRVFPALWAFIAIMFIATSFYPSIGVHSFDVISALTFTINYRSDNLPGVIAHLWSLCVEEHSYVLLSLVAIWHRRYRCNVPFVLWTLAGACMLNGIIQTWIFDLNYYEVYWRSDVRMSSVLAAAALYLQLKNVPVYSAVPIVATVLGLAICISASVPDPIRYTIGTVLLALGVATVPSIGAFFIRALGHPLLTSFGVLSYSLYLWQQPFHQLVGHIAIPLLLTCVAVLSALSFFLVENSSRTALNNLYRRPAHATASK